MSCPYHPSPIAVNSTVQITRQSVGGFLAVTSGTLTITRFDGTAVLTNFPVTGGSWYEVPLYLGVTGGFATTAGGASGTLAV